VFIRGLRAFRPTIRQDQAPCGALRASGIAKHGAVEDAFVGSESRTSSLLKFERITAAYELHRTAQALPIFATRLSPISQVTASVRHRTIRIPHRPLAASHRHRLHAAHNERSPFNQRVGYRLLPENAPESGMTLDCRAPRPASTPINQIRPRLRAG